MKEWEVICPSSKLHYGMLKAHENHSPPEACSESWQHAPSHLPRFNQGGTRSFLCKLHSLLSPCGLILANDLLTKHGLWVSPCISTSPKPVPPDPLSSVGFRGSQRSLDRITSFLCPSPACVSSSCRLSLHYALHGKLLPPLSALSVPRVPWHSLAHEERPRLRIQ